MNVGLLQKFKHGSSFASFLLRSMKWHIGCSGFFNNTASLAAIENALFLESLVPDKRQFDQKRIGFL